MARQKDAKFLRVSNLQGLQPLVNVRYKRHMRRLPIVDRIRQNVLALMKQPNRQPVKQAALMKATGLSRGQVSSFLNGRYGIGLKHLDGLAHALGVSVAELVRDTERPLMELTNDQARLIAYTRAWHPEVLAALMLVLDYFHAQPEFDELTANMLHLWRKMKTPERALAYANALRRREESIPPEVIAAAEILAADEVKPSEGGRRRRRTNEP